MLAVENLFKTYRGGRRTPAVEAVRGVSFEVGAGEVFGLLGPNGAGKSTTLGCITTLVRPTSGTIRVDGLDIERSAVAVRRRLAVVPQTRNLDRDLSLRETLRFHGAYFGVAAAERGPRADGLLERLQLTDKADSKPAALSGGQQQRALIARALMHDPKLLLLDEPTIGLDPQARRALWSLLGELRSGGRTIVLTTHYMEEADLLCDRVAIVDHGRILALDRPSRLKASLPRQILDVAASGCFGLEAALRRLPGVADIEARGEPGADPGAERWRLYVSAGPGLVDRVTAAVREVGGALTMISLTPPSLEDVYIHLTGRERLV